MTDYIRTFSGIHLILFACSTKLVQITEANRAKIERSLQLLAAKLQHQARPAQGTSGKHNVALSLPFELAVRAASFLLQHSLGQRVGVGEHRHVLGTPYG